MKLPAGCFFLLISLISSAQATYEPLNNDFSGVYDKYFNSPSSNAHTSIKPYLGSDIGTYADSVQKKISITFPPSVVTGAPSQRTDRSHLEIMPLFTLVPSLGLSESKMLFELAGGITVQGNLKKKLAWNFNFLSGNSTFANYIDSTAKYAHIIPEMGRAYGDNKYSYQYYSGYLSYSPNRIFNFQAGRDKNFWGDGYRSLFLSDVAAPYPFLKITTKVWNLKYVVLYAMQKDISANTGFVKDDKTKFGVYHYLSWNIVPRFNIGFFESIVWQGNDTTRARSYDINYLDPFIFFRPIEYSLGSSDNALLGGSFKVKAGRKQLFYGQLILDEFFLKEIVKLKGWWGNKQGIQLGFRDFDLFTIKSLDLRLELNCARPYTYSHGSVQQNYGHFDQPLAHPMGANFREGVGILDYRVKNFIIETKGIYAVYGLDTAGRNFGQNIYNSYLTHYREYGNYSGQGLRTFLYEAGLRVGWLLGLGMNLEADAGIMLRTETNYKYTLNTTIVYIGLRTALWNTYRDY